ncbi:MAG: hypothetical protein NO474_05415 [Methanomassiliicoccales archaeon]|nr:hypothetical protein [Methanomassiliicoccales archaeon]
MVLTPHMRQLGVTPNLLKTTKQVTCPRCGKTFSLFQSRAIACRGCRRSATTCELARCPFCDFEFPLQQLIVSNEQRQREISRYMNKIVNDYHRSVGKRTSR